MQIFFGGEMQLIHVNHENKKVQTWASWTAKKIKKKFIWMGRQTEIVVLNFFYS